MTQALLYASQAAVRCGNGCRDVLTAQAKNKRRKTSGVDTQKALHGGVEAHFQLIEALISAIYGVAQTAQYSVGRQAGIALTCMHEMESASALHAKRKRSDALFNSVLRGSDQFRSCRWSRSAQIGNKVRNREVGLVADGRDDRELGVRDGAG